MTADTRIDVPCADCGRDRGHPCHRKAITRDDFHPFVPAIAHRAVIKSDGTFQCGGCGRDVYEDNGRCTMATGAKHICGVS